MRKKDITFLYSSKKDKGFIYEELFEKWNKRDNFYSHLKLGRFTEEELKEILPIDKNSVYIIAGPMSMNIFIKSI